VDDKSKVSLFAFATLFGICVLATSLGAAAQTTSQPTITKDDFDTYRLYYSLFKRVQGVEILAQRSEARGTDPHHDTRRIMLKEFGNLSDQEGEILRKIALDAVAKTNALRQQWKDAADAFQQQNKAPLTGKTITPQLRQQKQHIERQRFQTTVDHISQLKAALGAARFQQLDSWVRTEMHN